jgi:hypothetical protein
MLPRCPTEQIQVMFVTCVENFATAGSWGIVALSVLDGFMLNAVLQIQL